MKVNLGRTEVQYDTEKPQFVRSFEVDYFFEENQTFVAEAYDMDDESH